MIAPNLPDLKESLSALDRGDKRKILQMLAEELSVEVDWQGEAGQPAMLPLIRAPSSAIAIIEALEREAQHDG